MCDVQECPPTSSVSVWSTCSVAYQGPVGPRAHYIHLLLDKQTGWPEVLVTRSSSLDKVVQSLTTVFSTYGVPARILHDSGIGVIEALFQGGLLTSFPDFEFFS